MAGPFAIATQILDDGPRNTVVKVTGDIQAAFAQTTIVTASLLSSMLPAFAGAFPPTLLRVDHIDYAIGDGAIAQLMWHATTDVPIVELYGRGKIASHHYGGLQNNAGAGVTGDIDLAVIAAQGATITEVSIMLIIHMVKNRAGGA